MQFPEFSPQKSLCGNQVCERNQAVSREEELLKLERANMLRGRLGRKTEGTACPYKRTDKVKGYEHIGGDYGKPSEGHAGLKEEG